MPSSEHFSAAELACKHCGANRMQPAFLARLEALRTAVGQPLALTSAYRCPTHNQRVSTTGADGPHTTGRAVDVRVAGGVALQLISLALGLGFTGVGVQQTGEHAGRFLHLDDLPNGPGQPRPWLWSY